MVGWTDGKMNKWVERSLPFSGISGDQAVSGQVGEAIGRPRSSGSATEDRGLVRGLLHCTSSHEHTWLVLSLSLSPLTAAATSWTGWAMSSLTSKFYKPPSTAATPSTGTVVAGGKQQEAHKPEGMREHPVLCVPACSWYTQLVHSVHENIRV